jgi:hypothetical protein
MFGQQAVVAARPANAVARAGTAAAVFVYGFEINAVPLRRVRLAPNDVVQPANANEKITGQDETVSNLSVAAPRDFRAHVVFGGLPHGIVG